MDEANEALPRQSERCGVQTEKMLVYQQKALRKKDKKALKPV